MIITLTFMVLIVITVLFVYVLKHKKKKTYPSSPMSLIDKLLLALLPICFFVVLAVAISGIYGAHNNSSSSTTHGVTSAPLVVDMEQFFRELRTAKIVWFDKDVRNGGEIDVYDGKVIQTKGYIHADRSMPDISIELYPTADEAYAYSGTGVCHCSAWFDKSSVVNSLATGQLVTVKGVVHNINFLPGVDGWGNYLQNTYTYYVSLDDCSLVK